MSPIPSIEKWLPVELCRSKSEKEEMKANQFLCVLFPFHHYLANANTGPEQISDWNQTKVSRHGSGQLLCSLKQRRNWLTALGDVRLQSVSFSCITLTAVLLVPLILKGTYNCLLPAIFYNNNNNNHYLIYMGSSCCNLIQPTPGRQLWLSL